MKNCVTTSEKIQQKRPGEIPTCSAVTDSTGKPICFVQVSMTAATGFALA